MLKRYMVKRRCTMQGSWVRGVSHILVPPGNQNLPQLQEEEGYVWAHVLQGDNLRGIVDEEGKSLVKGDHVFVPQGARFLFLNGSPEQTAKIVLLHIRCSGRAEPDDAGKHGKSSGAEVEDEPAVADVQREPAAAEGAQGCPRSVQSVRKVFGIFDRFGRFGNPTPPCWNGTRLLWSDIRLHRSCIRLH